MIGSFQPTLARSWMLAIAFAAVVFAAVAPTLRWPQFVGGNENIVVQTALEMRHGGPKLLPQMMGEPRVKKPPLVAWITALSMRPQTIQQLENPKLREQAYIDLAWQVRWTGLLAGCVLMLATFELGRVLFSPRIGLFACLVVATNVLFQKYMRQSTSDVHLAMWVTIANMLFAHGLFRGRIWTAATLGSMATAMAFLCKGPVALIETIVPAVAMLAVSLRRESMSPRSRLVFPLIVGFAIFIAIALPWFAHVYLTVPDVMSNWFKEVSRHGATDLAPNSPAVYLEPLPLMWPWVVMLVGGMFVLTRERTRSDWYLMAMFWLPVLIMVWFPDRKERYLLPMVAPLAITVARGLESYLKSPTGDCGVKWATAIHYLLLVGVSIGLVIAFSRSRIFLTLSNEQWYTPQLSVWVAVVVACVIGLGLLFQLRKRISLLPTTFIVMLILQAALMWGYCKSPNGMSSMKPLADYIRFAAPDALVYDWNADGRRVEEDLPIYLNRPVHYADPHVLVATDRPMIYVTRQSDRDQKAGIQPTPPAGWQILKTAKEGNNIWWAFILTPPGYPGSSIQN